jgi:D-alanyl-D-alanine carboxypeptidase
MMILRRRLLAAAPALALSAPSQALALQRLNLKAIGEHERIPALGLIVMTSTRVKHVQVVGRRSLAAPDPATTNDVWRIADNTMSLTAALYARLVEGGKASWRAKLSALAPHLQLPQVWRDATLETFLAHRSGLDDTTLITETWLAQRRADTRPLTVQRAEFLNFVLDLTPERPVGAFQPARANYIVAAAILETLSGQAYEDLAKAEAFDWWGAYNAGFGTPLGAQPQGHRIEADGRLSPVSATSAEGDPAILNPATGAHLSLNEYGRFLQLFLTDGGGWLKPASLSHLARSWDPKADGFGLGWRFTRATEEWAKGPTLTHEGGDGLWRAHAVIAPGRDLALAVVCNADNLNACQTTMTEAIKVFAADAPVFNELKF